MLVPDEIAPDLYEDDIEPNLDAGAVVNFASGYNVTYGFIDPDEHLDVVMVAPRMIGTMVRELYVEGRGAPALLAVHRDASGDAEQVASRLRKVSGRRGRVPSRQASRRRPKRIS